MIVVPYALSYKEIWDSFVVDSKNGTFLLMRDYMDYHADRFFDCSLLVYEGEPEGADAMGPRGRDGLKAVFPANWVEEERTVYSHRGLTYGGLIVDPEITQMEVLVVMQKVMQYYRDMLQATTLVYKPIPYIYSPYPSGEDLFALYRGGARLLTRNVSSVVALRNPLRLHTLRRRQARKALDHNFYIELVPGNDTQDIHAYWTLLSEVLEEHHGAHPVHSEEEMTLLMNRFPREIKLFIVKHEEHIVAGCVVFVTRQVAHIQYIASGQEGRKYGALDLLFRHLINERFRQMEYLDFGRSMAPDGISLNQGLIFQKEGFGARTVCYDTYEVALTDEAIETMTDAGTEKEDIIIRYADLRATNDSFAPRLTQAMEHVMITGSYLQGACVKDFEQKFAQYCGAQHCVMVANGMDAMSLTLRALKTLGQWQDGDEVIVPANVHRATLLAIDEARLTPVLCEPSLQDYLLDVEYMKRLLTERTRAVVAVHLFGRVCQMDTIGSWAAEHGLRLVEEGSHAHGAQYLGQYVGHLADAATFSFHPSLNLGALGDAGCVTTDDPQLATTLRQMADYGGEPHAESRYRGISSHADELQAAVLGVKLPRLDADNERRRQLANLYAEGIQNPLVTIPTLPSRAELPAYYGFSVRCPAREQLQQFLLERGIQTCVHYPVAPQGPKPYGEWAVRRMPITERLLREVLSLPIGPLMTDDQVRRIVKALNEFNADL